MGFFGRNSSDKKIFMKKVLLYFYYIMSKIGVIRMFYWLNRHKSIVLTYHNIIPDHLFDDSVHLGVSHSVSVFESHLSLVKRRFLNNKIKSKVCLTFDDGYKNQYALASKILEKYGLQGVFFISFKPIIDRLPLIIDKIMMWVSYVPFGDYTIFNHLFLIHKENRHQIASQLYQKLLDNYSLWDTIEAELNKAYSFDRLTINTELKKLRFDPLDSSDLLELIKNGHHVAAHSWDHRPLATLPKVQQEKDFALCKKYAEKYCNSNWYSYPFGGKEEVSEETIRLCKEHGFSVAYMNNEILMKYPKADAQYQLPRTTLPNHNNYYLLDAKLSGFEFFCKACIKNLLLLRKLFQWKKMITSNG